MYSEYPLAAVDTGQSQAARCELVLVVDDDPVNLLLTTEMLSFIGIKPLLGDDGAEVVALACGLDLHPILMCLQMHVLDGFAATAQAKQRHRRRSGQAR